MLRTRAELSAKNIHALNEAHKNKNKNVNTNAVVNDLLLHLPGLSPRLLPPALHFFASRSSDKGESVIYWDMVTMWLHPLDLKVEEALLFQAMRLKDATHTKTVNGHRMISLTEAKESRRAIDMLKVGASTCDYIDSIMAGSDHLQIDALSPKGSSVTEKKKIFINFLHLHPIDIALSFKGTAGERASERSEAKRSECTDENTKPLLTNPFAPSSPRRSDAQERKAGRGKLCAQRAQRTGRHEAEARGSPDQQHVWRSGRHCRQNCQGE